MNFEQLLDGATKGGWVAVFPLILADDQRETVVAEVAGAASNPTAQNDARLIARCNPAVMREVWAALKKLTHETDCMMTALGDRGVDLDSDGMIDAMDALESGRRALALLDGQTEKGGAE